MSEKNTGGPAFPGADELIPVNGSYAQYKVWGSDGMTLRDYFAAKFIQQIWSESQPFSDYDCALRAYSLADAMLKARSS